MSIQQISNVGLKPSGFQFDIARYPDVDFPVQSVIIPSVSMNAAIQETPQVTLKHPGEKIKYPPLQIRFMLNTDLTNYIELFGWMKENASPQMPQDFASLSKQYAQATTNDDGQQYFSDLVLILLNNNNNPTLKFTFVDGFPINLSSINMDTTIDGQEYLYIDAAFEYSYFEVALA
jgi:hypothetical protein